MFGRRPADRLHLHHLRQAEPEGTRLRCYPAIVNRSIAPDRGPTPPGPG
jgi:hypothetical protein